MISRTSIAGVDMWAPMTNDPILGDVSRVGNTSQFQQKMELYNFLDRDVVICNREGIRFRLRRKNRESSFKGILVRVTLHFSEQDIAHDIEKDFNGTYEQYSPALQAIKKLWQRQEQGILTHLPNRRHNAYIEYKYTQEVIEAHDGALLLPEVDLQLFYADRYKELKEEQVHPESTVGQIRRAGFDLLGKIKANTASEGANFIFSIKIIDNSGNYGPRWIRLGDHVYRVDPVAEDSAASGVYIYRHEPVRTRESYQAPRVADRFDLDSEIPYIKLHKSYEEARHEGRSKEAINLEIAEKELQAKLQLSENSLTKAVADKSLLEATLQQAKERFEHEKLRFEHDKSKLEHEKAVLKDEIQRQAKEIEFEREKLKVEKGMLLRKAVIDLFKSIPVLLTGGLALIAALMKLLKPAAAK